MRRKPMRKKVVPRDIVIGLDPSSKKLAFVVTVKNGAPLVYVHKMNMKRIEERCASAFTFTAEFLAELNADIALPKDRMWFFIEDAVVGRGGAYATIAQSKVHGAVVAAAVLSGRCEYVAAENNSRVKKAVVGKGNANKDDIKAWARKYWRALFDEANNDQDVIDAGMHNRFGAQVTEALKRVQANRKGLGQ